jgi:hypothetical protein
VVIKEEVLDILIIDMTLTPKLKLKSKLKAKKKAKKPCYSSRVIGGKMLKD